MIIDLSGKVAIVTGERQGIGRRIAIERARIALINFLYSNYYNVFQVIFEREF